MIRLLLAGLVALAGFAGGVAAQDYQIRIGDTLDVSVLEDPGLNRQVLVRPDGKISLPLAGTFQAAGVTPEALQAAIRRRLAGSFVEPPSVTVAVTDLGEGGALSEGQRGTIYVIGEVRDPGRYDVDLPIDVLQALALSGGPGAFAARTRIQIRRRTPEGERVFLFDYDSLEDGLVPSAPIGLAAGDVIVVPERGLFE